MVQISKGGWFGMKVKNSRIIFRPGSNVIYKSRGVNNDRAKDDSPR